MPRAECPCNRCDVGLWAIGIMVVHVNVEFTRTVVVRCVRNSSLEGSSCSHMVIFTHTHTNSC